MLHELLHYDRLAVVWLRCQLLADLDDFRQLPQGSLEASLTAPEFHIEGLPGEAKLRHALLYPHRGRSILAPENSLLPLHRLQCGERAGTCRRDIVLDQHPGHPNSGWHAKVRNQRQGIGPALRGQLLIQARAMREASRYPSPFHGLHQHEEGLLLHQSCPAVLPCLHGGHAVLFEGSGVEEIHGANPPGTTRWMVRPEDEVSSFGELPQVAVVLHVYSPDLIVIAQLRANCQVQQCIQEDLGHGTTRLSPLLGRDNLIHTTPTHGDNGELWLCSRNQDVPRSKWRQI
mmetsp:Transcript_25830/g.57006  ORF Transcript_25830/g.57006 Transcript_25830/m.57006 type:complete len:288 (+) Transcript_25830:960-1823(+)